MSDFLACYHRASTGEPGFDHEDGAQALRLTMSGWLAYRSPTDLVLTPEGGPCYFASAARAARYLEEHPEYD